jgi:hypothetical protein
MGVDAARFRNDVAGQCVEIGGLEFGGLAPCKDVVDDRVLAFEGGEGLFVGLVLAGLGFLRLVGEAELVEEDFAELFGRGDVEGTVGVFVDRFRKFVDLLLEFRADGRRGRLGSMAMPSISMRTRTGSSGLSMLLRILCCPASSSSGRSFSASCQVTSASSAAYSARVAKGWMRCRVPWRPWFFRRS